MQAQSCYEIWPWLQSYGVGELVFESKRANSIRCKFAPLCTNAFTIGSGGIAGWPHPHSNHILVTKLFCPWLPAPVLISACLRHWLRKASLLVFGALFQDVVVFLFSSPTYTLCLWITDPTPSLTSPPEGDQTSPAKKSKSLWQAASFLNEVYFSCKMHSVRGGILLAVLLMARAQQIPTTTPASQGWERNMVKVMVTRWCLREVSRWWGDPLHAIWFHPSTGSLFPACSESQCTWRNIADPSRIQWG